MGTGFEQWGHILFIAMPPAPTREVAVVCVAPQFVHFQSCFLGSLLNHFPQSGQLTKQTSA